MNQRLDKKIKELAKDNTYSKLKNYFNGEKCIVFGCGPSLNDYEPSLLIDRFHDHYFLCIKQSFYRFKDRCNIHFINDNNMIRYEYTEDQIVVSSGGPVYPFRHLLSKDPSFHYTIHNLGYNKTIAKTNDFSMNEFDEHFHVHWGPGIMYEVVVPFVVHSGFSKVKLLGWDYTDSNVKHLPHYYNENNRVKFHNPENGCEKNETQDIIKSTCYLYDYLSDKNIDCEIITDKSYVSKKFPRRKVE